MTFRREMHPKIRGVIAAPRGTSGGLNSNRERYNHGRDVNRPKEVRHCYNYTNQRVDFDDMEVVHTYEYEPNQAVLFIKTHNSWHSVRPMAGIGSSAFRKTLTINIVRDR
jgi:hypothetical protein